MKIRAFLMSKEEKSLGYSKDVYDKASSELENRRFKAEREYAARKEEIFAKFPRIKEIENELSNTYSKVARAVFTDKPDARKQLEQIKQNSLKLQVEQKQILINGNYPADYLTVKYHCRDCKDTGYIDGKMCSCMKTLLRETAYQKLNSSSPLSLSDFSSFSLDYYSDAPLADKNFSPRSRMSQIFEYCKKYAENFTANSKSLLFQGEPGLGKTHLSLAIATVAINKGYGVIYISAPTAVSALEKERFSRNEQGSETEKMLVDCDLLILDDLGTEFITAFSTSKIYDIINTRFMLNKPIIISTNYTMTELEKNYSIRLVSRIIGETDRITFVGEDIRQLKQKNKMKKR